MTTTKNPHAVKLGRLGGKKGGTSRWANWTDEQRAAHMAKMRAAKKPKTPPLARSKKK